jgi:hypothetical protein
MRTTLGVFVSVSVIVTAICIMWLGGGNILRSRFHVGDYAYPTAAGSTALFNSETVLIGMHAALLSSKLDPSAWTPLTNSDNQHPYFEMRTNGQKFSDLIVLKNCHTGKILYANVSLTQAGDKLKYEIYRSQ